MLLYFFFAFLFLFAPSLSAMLGKGSPPIPIPTSARFGGQKNGVCLNDSNFPSNDFFDSERKKIGSICGTYVGGPFLLEGVFSRKDIKEGQADKPSNVARHKVKKLNETEKSKNKIQNDAIIQSIKDNLNFGKYSSPRDLKQLIEESGWANVAVIGEMGMTLLHLVARQKIEFEENEIQKKQIGVLLEVINILKERGANFKAENDIGKTPYELARMLRKPQEIVDALKIMQ